MKRRDFIKKTGFLTILSLYALSGNACAKVGEKIMQTDRDEEKSYHFDGAHTARLAGEQIRIPHVFISKLKGEDFVLVVPEKNTSVLIIPERSTEWKALRQLCDAAEGAGSPVHWEQAKINADGNLFLSERVKQFSGIHNEFVRIIGHGNVIEIMD